jgi:hypothetical protein
MRTKKEKKNYSKKQYKQQNGFLLIFADCSMKQQQNM